MSQTALAAARVALEQEIARCTLHAAHLEDELARVKANVIGLGHELVLARADVRAAVDALEGHDCMRRQQRGA